MGAKRMSEVDDTHRGKRAPNGSGSQVTFRVRRDVVELVTILARAEGIDAALAEHKLDALVAPTGGPAWLTDLVNGDHYGGSFSTPAAVAGYPHVTVPMGFVHGLPLGLSFVGPAYSEALLVGLAYAFEQATQARRPPTYARTAPLRVS